MLYPLKVAVAAQSSVCVGADASGPQGAEAGRACPIAASEKAAKTEIRLNDKGLDFRLKRYATAQSTRGVFPRRQTFGYVVTTASNDTG